MLGCRLEDVAILAVGDEGLDVHCVASELFDKGVIGGDGDKNQRFFSVVFRGGTFFCAAKKQAHEDKKSFHNGHFTPRAS